MVILYLKRPIYFYAVVAKLHISKLIALWEFVLLLFEKKYFL